MADTTTTFVSLQRSSAEETPDQALWAAIRNRSIAVSFKAYSSFIERALCAEQPSDTDAIGAPTIREEREALKNLPTIHGVDAYRILRLATQAFLLLQAGIVEKDATLTQYRLPRLDPAISNDPRVQDSERIARLLAQYFGSTPDSALPYLQRIVLALDETEEGMPFCEHLLRHRLTSPSMIELIWSYWQEQGMLVQTMKTISLRFQNRRQGGTSDPLANFELSHLRPLGNLLWGYVQDEQNRLSVVRRAYEYDHHYGLTLAGKAVPALETADSRSKFLEAFHNLLSRTAAFYKDDADTTVIADGFPLLNALKEVHLILAEGAHNQFGDLPWTSRAEMLLEQWLLARPEMKAFLRGRYAVPYQEEWMGAVDAMNRLQGWHHTTVTHFHTLAVFGERIFQSVRYGDWSDIDNKSDQAKNWARDWKPEIQGYIHAYQAATGVDLGVEITDTRRAQELYTQPSILLAQRFAKSGASARVAPAEARRLDAGAPAMPQAIPAPTGRRLLARKRDEKRANATKNKNTL